MAFPEELVCQESLLNSGPGHLVLDLFAGIGTVGRVARQNGRRAWLIERELGSWPLTEAADGRAQQT